MKSINYLIKPNKINVTKLSYCPPKFIQTPSTLDYVDGFGNPLASAVLMEDGNKIIIMDLLSNIKNNGYGSKIINKIKEIYQGKTLELCACWEKFISPKPPHKFYMKNGFVPKNQSILEKLNSWINNGAKSQTFPPECDCCEMVFKP